MTSRAMRGPADRDVMAALDRIETLLGHLVAELRHVRRTPKATKVERNRRAFVDEIKPSEFAIAQARKLLAKYGSK